VCIFVKDNVQSRDIKLNKYSKEKDLEICTVKLHISSHTIVVIAIYRMPSGNFACFLDSLESILNWVYNNSINIILCGDLNVNYLNDNHKIQLLDSLLASYSLHGNLQFPVRILNNNYVLIYYIFSQFDHRYCC
jgi:hypothetical protein